MTIALDKIAFNLVCPIEPLRRADGQIEEIVFPQCAEGRAPHKYGSGSFCRFDIPDGYREAEGVYVLLCDRKVMYVGECEDLSNRYRGYGHVSQRMTQVGGQPTNCRINHLIFESMQRGSQVELYFHPSRDRMNLESFLIERFAPAWNRTAGKYLDERAEPLDYMSLRQAPEEEDNLRKYDPLKRYLAVSSHRYEVLSLVAIEGLLQETLPPSARKHRQWWANGGHAHSDVWLSAGWQVAYVKADGYVVYQRKANLSAKTA